MLSALLLIASLPPGVEVEGKPVASLDFDDSRGRHVVVVSETEPRGGGKKLFGYHFTLGKGGKWRQLWQTKDFVLGCEFDLTLAYEPGSLAVSDLDGDGVKETRFAYRRSCRSDVSPDELKLLLHEGERKYAVRGTTRALEEKERPEPDPAFKGAPPAFLESALADWLRYATREP